LNPKFLDRCSVSDDDGLTIRICLGLDPGARLGGSLLATHMVDHISLSVSILKGPAPAALENITLSDQMMAGKYQQYKNI
jgi:hypothetical protein